MMAQTAIEPSSGSVSGAVNDKTVVADTQKFNQNLQDDIDEAAQQAEAAAGNVTDVIENGFGFINRTNSKYYFQPDQRGEFIQMICEEMNIANKTQSYKNKVT